MPLAHFTNLLTLNEEKYINERRKLILENIFNDNPIDFIRLELIKSDFLERIPIPMVEPKYF